MHCGQEPSRRVPSAISSNFATSTGTGRLTHRRLALVSSLLLPARVPLDLCTFKPHASIYLYLMPYTARRNPSPLHFILQHRNTSQAKDVARAVYRVKCTAQSIPYTVWRYPDEELVPGCVT